MKKFLAMLTVVSMVLLTACQGGGEEVSKGSDENQVIEMWHIETGEREKYFEDIVAQFEKDHPGKKVKLLRIPNDAYKQKLSVAMSGGNPPDIFQSWGGGWLKNFVDQGNVLDITDKVDQDLFLENAIANTKFDEKVYGVPLGISTDVIFYNKEIFAKYNLKEPKTYEEFVKVIETLKENNIIPLSLTNKTKWPGSYFFMNFAGRIAGPELFDSAFNRTGRGFDDPAFVEAGEYIQELVKMDAFNPGANGIPYDEGRGRQLLYTGEAAMMDMTTSFVNNIREENPEFEKKLGFFPFPTVADGKGVQTEIGAATGPVFSVTESAEDPDLAAQLINEMTTKENGQIYTDKTGSLTAIKGAVPNDETMKPLYELIQNATYMQMPYDQTLPPELAELHKDTTQAIYGLSMTPKEAAEKMEAKAKELLDK
ncbi:ABC transporter substrate-binding protein [Bacillus sp. V2I10]|uniref:ABC transporter substrate-binding protein n=1 Tax=Bacillus sp. V2I10 TaxID=3042276 RepID=UPI002788836D|nr:extracellular solute-binding protein [Bacillus sp. V2I10]MDQ0861894.1 raffinose/stachyose/melibiose transport system substrate-binding protein [Bacillus sp. V2I10]